jgi:hypothetical protein
VRSDALPDIPIVADTVPGFEASAWFGIGAPRKYARRDRQLAQPRDQCRIADPRSGCGSSISRRHAGSGTPADSAGSLKTVAVAGPAYLGETKRQPEQERGSSLLALAYLAPLDAVNLSSRAAVRIRSALAHGRFTTRSRKPCRSVGSLW